MIGNKTVNLIIVALLLLIVAFALSFFNGPGVIRDLLPSFIVGETEEVEWDKQFFIEDPRFVVISINPTDLRDNDNYYYRYVSLDDTLPIDLEIGGFEPILDQPLVSESSWEVSYGSWPVPNGKWDRLSLIKTFSLYTDPQNKMLSILKKQGFEDGLREIISYFVNNKEGYGRLNDVNLEIFVGNSADPVLVYEEDSASLKDVDFIIDTINRLTRIHKRQNKLE
tara:strand:+ start:268 stop:939 length:672 start_codon:yes stop_codon:yes gene_type:complete